MPRFSIIIPVFNKEKFVAKTLKSVLAQTFTDYEIIIVNDGSTDGSEQAILAIDDERIRYFLKDNEGVAIARNYGLSKISSDYICFLDADDFWYPKFLFTMDFYIKRLPDESVFACAIEIETNRKVFKAKYSIDQKEEFKIVNFFHASQKEAVMWTSAVCVHKDVLVKSGAFDKDLTVSEDTDLWIRIGLRYRVVFIRKILARYVFDKKSISRNLDYIFEYLFFEKYETLEKRNTSLKKYMDQNRFSCIIKYKLKGDLKSAAKMYTLIDLENLSRKKKLLLELSPGLLRILVRLQRFSTNIGLGSSVFR